VFAEASRAGQDLVGLNLRDVPLGQGLTGPPHPPGKRRKAVSQPMMSDTFGHANANRKVQGRPFS
jgi:hypothetical protein